MGNCKVQMCQTCLQSNSEHTLYFDRLESQLSYFSQQTYRQFNDCTYIRKDNVLRIPSHLDNAISCDYVVYQNTDYSNKWYFAFVKEAKYINDGCTELILETDVIQTYLFDYSVGPCFVEREHVSDDTIGLHTIPENVQLGEFVCDSYSKDENLKPSEYIVVGSTVGQTPAGTYEECMGTRYSGIFSGPFYFKYKWHDMQTFLQGVVNKKDETAISSLFLAPEFLIPSLTEENRFKGDIQGSLVPYWYNVLKSKPTTLNGYKPKNNKLLTSPYVYLYVSNGNGATAEYNYEFFKESDGSEGSCNFKVIGSLTPGCSIRLIPQYYKGVENNEGEGINLGKYPQCNWATDQFTNWLTQNGVNVAGSIVGAGLSIAGGIATGGLALAVGGSSIISVASTINEVYKAYRQPPQTSGNINCGDVVCSNGDNTFHFYQMSIKKEYAQLIDEFFSMYGYKVNRVKIPNKNHRYYWWYTKTIDANIKGTIPNNDRLKIKELYDKGITFWKYPNYFKEYSYNNAII